MRLRDWRKLHGLTQVKLAELLGVTEQTIVRWELDQTTPPTKYQRKILVLTGGAVTPNDMMLPAQVADQLRDSAA